MRTLAKILGYSLVIIFVIAIIGFAYKYTNGFNEDLKTFYIEHNGKQILTTENKMTFEKESVHRFEAKYTFDKDDAEPKGYKVKIVPNMTRDFDYTVDGKKYLFSKVGDLTSAFEIIQHDTFFELYIPEGLSFSEILKKAHNGYIVSVSIDVLADNPYPFRLQISSYNEKVIYNIDFDIEFSETGSLGQTSGSDGSTKQGYAISWRFIGNENNLLTAEVVCPETAVADETVHIAVSLIGNYKSEVLQVAYYSGGKLFDNINVNDYTDFSSNYYNDFTFTMPEGNVEIVVIIKTIEVSEYRSISFETLGSGSVDSVNVYCADVAKPDDYVTCSIYLAWDVTDLEISRVVLINADTGDEIFEIEQYEYFDFSMPDCDVVIMIYLMSV